MQWHLLGWINRGMIEKARQDLETNIRSSDKSERTIEAKLTWVTGKYEPRGERDVIRFRNPTEDKRAFQRMLTSADPDGRSVARSVTWLANFLGWVFLFTHGVRWRASRAELLYENHIFKKRENVGKAGKNRGLIAQGNYILILG